MSDITCTACGEAIEFRTTGCLGRFATVETGAVHCTASPTLSGHTLPRAPFVAMVGKRGPAFASPTEPRLTASAAWVVNEEYAANVPPMPSLRGVFHVASETVAATPWTPGYVGQPREYSYYTDTDY